MNNKITNLLVIFICIFVLQGCNSDTLQSEIELAEVEVEESVINKAEDEGVIENEEIVQEESEETTEDASKKTATTTIFLVELYNPDKEFTREWVKETGCEDHLVPFEVKIEPTKAMLNASLEQLFSIKNNIPDDLYNALDLSDISIEGISIEDNTAIVNLAGPYAMAGSCSGPRFVDQIKETVLQFKNVENTEIYLDGRELESFALLK